MDKTINDLAADKELKLSSKAADVNGTNFWVTNALNDNTPDEDGWQVAGFIDDFSGVSGGERESKTATPINTNQYETIISQGAIKKEDFTLKSYYDFTATEGVNLIRKAFNDAKAVFIKIQVPDGSETTIIQRGKVSKFAITTEKDGKYMADVTIMKEGDENVKRKFKPDENQINFKIGAGDEEPIVGVTYAKWADKVVCFNSFDASVQPKKVDVRKLFKFDKAGKCLSKSLQKWDESKGTFVAYQAPKFVAPVDSATVEVLYEGEEIVAAQAGTRLNKFEILLVAGGSNGAYMSGLKIYDFDGNLYTYEKLNLQAGENAMDTYRFNLVGKDGSKTPALAKASNHWNGGYSVEAGFNNFNSPSGCFLGSSAGTTTITVDLDNEVEIGALEGRYGGYSSGNLYSKTITYKYAGKESTDNRANNTAGRTFVKTVLDLTKPIEGVQATQPTPGATNIDWRSKTVLFYEKESNIAKPTPMSVRYKYNVDDQGVIGAQIREVFSEMDNAYHYQKAPAPSEA